MAKKLTLTAMKKDHTKIFNEKTKITLSNGDYLHIYKEFKTTSIQKLVVDYMEIIEELKKRQIGFKTFKDMTFVYYMLLLKHFTDLNNIPTDIEKMIIICEELINLDLLEQIMQAFPEDQLKKIKKLLDKANENSELLGKHLNDPMT
ncbi:hypothetical protein BC351_10265 [Paenibacillus ferrarius]|uniref:Uncharacterized protein n=1 Tax=Paenibacillus ferrarius TaxID=1469647 RepID=A0A1V4H8T3_9BACL|nr:hypothetical protein [Paenibacillus ferrarius]OPH47568.1 hypothetical protein BC351_10265 [Paenibacillus ferrarius]